MKNDAQNHELPLGFGMALARNPEAMNRFAAMSDGERQAAVKRTEGIQTKKEMQAYVQSLIG